jgi:hypothetical protein
MTDDDIYLYYNEDLPCTVAGVSAENPDGTFTILINPKLSYDAQKDAYRHELAHIAHDYGKKSNVSDIELESKYSKRR